MKTARPISPSIRGASAILCGLLLFSVSNLMTVGAETVGWKIPLESLTAHGLQSPGVVRLEAPPEKSPLFGEKDELWDVSKALSIHLNGKKTIPHLTHPPMEWVAWNANTQRLVTKCDWRGIWQLYNLLGIGSQPRQHRYHLALYDSQDGRSKPARDAKPLISLSSISRPGVKSLASGEGRTIEIEGELNAADDLPWIGTSLSWSAELPGRAGIRSSVTFTARSGKPMVIAGDVLNGEGWVAVFTATSELTDGTAYEDIAWLVEGGKVRRLEADRRATQRTRVGDRWLISTWVYPNAVSDMFKSNDSSGPEVEIDPFAETPLVPKEPVSFPLLAAPKALSEWCSEEVWDMSDLLKNIGIRLDEGDVAGYDPKRQEMFFYSASATELDKFECLFMLGCIRDPLTVGLMLDTPHPSFLVSRSGNRVTLERISGELVVKSVRFEPTITDSGYLLDTRVEYESITSQETHKLETAVTAKSGVPLVIHQPPGDGKPWVLTAEIKRGHE